MACKDSVFHASRPFNSVSFWFWSKSTLRKAWVLRCPPSVVNTSPLAPECGHWEARWPALRQQACWVHSLQFLRPAVPARHAASPVPGTTSAPEEVRVPGSCGVCRFLPRIRSWQVKLRKTPASEDCELPSGTQEPCAGDLGLKPLGARRASRLSQQVKNSPTGACRSLFCTYPAALAAPKDAPAPCPASGDKGS